MNASSIVANLAAARTTVVRLGYRDLDRSASVLASARDDLAAFTEQMYQGPARTTFGNAVGDVDRALRLLRGPSERDNLLGLASMRIDDALAQLRQLVD